MREKRSYTLPVLLLIIVGLAMLAVVLASRLLIAQQADNTDKGQRIAASYQEALLFAQQLEAGADKLLSGGDSTAERMAAARSLGQAQMAMTGAADLFVTYVSFERSGGDSSGADQVMLDLNALALEANAGIGAHDGALTEEERRMLGIWRDGAAAMKNALAKFAPEPTKEGYRKLLAGGEWVTSAGQARQALADMAAQLSP